MKILWIVVTLIPTPFLFHYFEYELRNNLGNYSTFLVVGILLFVILNGILSADVKMRYVLGINLITAVLSLFLASVFIANDGGWFEPLGRDTVIVITSIVYVIGQLFVRAISRAMMKKEME